MVIRLRIIFRIMGEQISRQRCRKRSLVLLCLYLVPTTAFQPTRPVFKGFSGRPKTRQRSNTRLMSAAPNLTPKPHISVSIDHPLLPDLLYTEGKKTSAKFSPANWISTSVSSTISSVSSTISTGASMIKSKNLKVAIAAFFVAFLLSMTVKYSGSIGEGIARYFRIVVGKFQRFMEQLTPAEEGIPMVFDTKHADGWGVCTLKSKRRLGKSDFVQYEFDLPNSRYVLPLELGQQITMMCLDNDSNIARGDFYPFYTSRSPKPGVFSILVPNKPHEVNVRMIGLDAANFARVVKQEMKVGDELALKPGSNRLSYRGQYLPVTDMVYIACGTGIVPVLDQVRAVLPSSASSVTTVNVVWINEHTRDFDVTSEILEKEYYKYSTKLAVSCIVDHMKGPVFGENVEVDDAVPDFRPGTMAVLSGPSDLMKKATSYLEDRGYPRDTICVL